MLLDILKGTKKLVIVFNRSLSAITVWKQIRTAKLNYGKHLCNYAVMTCSFVEWALGRLEMACIFVLILGQL